MRQLIVAVLFLTLLFGIPVGASAEEEAKNVTASTTIRENEGIDCLLLTDGLETESVYTVAGLSLQNDAGIGAVYLVLDCPSTITVQDAQTGESYTQRAEGFLHVFSDLEYQFGYAPKDIRLQFPQGAWITELQVFSPGEVPEYVQQWQQPATGSADIVLFSTHGDDEQLYFAGLLPYYAAERDLNVQVVYMTGHDNLSGRIRQHEMLNGLWAVGVRSYPVFGAFPDFKLLDREETYVEYENLGFSREDLLDFVVENIRRFRPQVAVGHDLNGEYGHGMHMVYADLLTKAVEVSADPEAFPESAQNYGVWDVPKTYLHLYEENEIVMDWDQPLESFGGMTAFEVAQKKGFPCHITQQFDLYVNWLYGDGITKASEIRQWSPCYFGLYRTTVGDDVQKNDLMENITPYAEMSRRADEQDQKLREGVRLAQEQQAVEPQLLRQNVEPPVLPAEENTVFPVGAALLALMSLAAIVAIFARIKIFEKK